MTNHQLHCFVISADEVTDTSVKAIQCKMWRSKILFIFISSIEKWKCMTNWHEWIKAFSEQLVSDCDNDNSEIKIRQNVCDID